MICRLCDEADVPGIPGVDDKVYMTATIQIESLKDLAYLALPRRSSEPAIVPQAQIEGPSVSTKSGDVHGGNVGFSIDLEIGEQREALDFIIR